MYRFFFSALFFTTIVCLSEGVAQADDGCPKGDAAFMSVRSEPPMTAETAADMVQVSNIFMACAIAEKVSGDKENSALAALQGARAAALAADTFRATWGVQSLNGDDDRTLENEAKQAMRNAIHCAEDVARMHVSSSKEASTLAYSWRAELANWWPGD